MKRLHSLALALFVALAVGVVSAALGDCDMVRNSRAVNSSQGTGWCEGWYNADCTYCWTTGGGGGSCATNFYYCGPHIKNPTP